MLLLAGVIHLSMLKGSTGLIVRGHWHGAGMNERPAVGGPALSLSLLHVRAAAWLVPHPAPGLLVLVGVLASLGRGAPTIRKSREGLINQHYSYKFCVYLEELPDLPALPLNSCPLWFSLDWSALATSALPYMGVKLVHFTKHSS